VDFFFPVLSFSLWTIPLSLFSTPFESDPQLIPAVFGSSLLFSFRLSEGCQAQPCGSKNFTEPFPLKINPIESHHLKAVAVMSQARISIFFLFKH